MKTNQAIYIYVGTAGIGRMSFGAWLSYDKIDRSDGDDAGTYPTIEEALSAAGQKLERNIIRAAWEHTKFVAQPLPLASVVVKGDGDVFVACVRMNGDQFLARWMCWTPNGFQLDEDLELPRNEVYGDTISGVLEDLGQRMSAELAHNAWVNQFR